MDRKTLTQYYRTAAGTVVLIYVPSLRLASLFRWVDVQLELYRGLRQELTGCEKCWRISLHPLRIGLSGNLSAAFTVCMLGGCVRCKEIESINAKKKMKETKLHGGKLT